MSTSLWITLGLALLTGMTLARANMCFMHAAKSTAEGRLQPLVNVLLTVAAATIVFAVCGYEGLRGPAPWALPSALTVLGGVLFGIGARVNGSCTIGTMGRLAHGDVGALATFAGGGLAVALLPHNKVTSDPPPWVPGVEIYWVSAVALVALIGVAILYRRGEKLERTIEVVLLGGFASLLYALRGQTGLMDAASAVMLDHGGPSAAAVALVGLFIGAIAVATATGRFRFGLPHPRRIPAEIVGGALMTSGALCIPGASDVVAFYGLPSGSPHAVVAWLLILATVVLSFRLTNSQSWQNAFHSEPP